MEITPAKAHLKRPTTDAIDGTLKQQLLHAQMALQDKELENVELRIKLECIRKHQTGVESAVDAAVAVCRADFDGRLAQVLAKLNAFQGTTPQEVTQLRLQNASLINEKDNIESRLAVASEHVEGLATDAREMMADWDTERAALRHDNNQLTAALRSGQSAMETMYQEKEVLRAKCNMLEARLSQEHPQVHSLQQSLNNTRAKLDERGAQCQHYKEVVHTLKQELADRDAALHQHSLRGVAMEEQVGQLQELSVQQAQEIAGLQEQVAEYTAQLADLHLQCTTWEGKAAAAEHKMHSTAIAAKSGASTTVRLAERRVQQAEHRAAQAEAQATAVSLRAVDQERRLAAAQDGKVEAEELRRALSGQVAECAVLRERLRRLKAVTEGKQAALLEAQHRDKGKGGVAERGGVDLIRAVRC